MAAVIVAAVLTLLTAMLTVPGTASAEPRHGPRVLRVMSYNIHTGIGTDGVSDLGRIASVIRDADVDVVALQEVDVHWADRSDYVDQATELARLTDMSVYFAPIYDLDPEPGREERRRYGVAVLSRHPVLSATNHEISRLSTVEPGAEPEPMPGFAEVVVSVRGLPVHVYNTHLDYRPDPTVRSRQVTEMLDILRQDPPRAHQLLLGDFNAEPAGTGVGAAVRTPARCVGDTGRRVDVSRRGPRQTDRLHHRGWRCARAERLRPRCRGLRSPTRGRHTPPAVTPGDVSRTASDRIRRGTRYRPPARPRRRGTR